MSRLAPMTLLILGSLLAAGLILFRISTLQTIGHDDGISYLAATCHQERWADSLPADRWVPAWVWKAYWTPDELGCFRRIGRDLGRRDIHPPLYFWLLHLWTYAVGVTLVSGPALNLIIVVLSIVALFKVGQQLGISRLSAAGAAIAYGLSTATLTTATAVRPYALLGLLVVVFVGAMLSCRAQRSGRALALVYTSTLAGLLTHYHFAIVFGFTALAVLAPLSSARASRVTRYALCGFALALAGTIIVYLNDRELVTTVVGPYLGVLTKVLGHPHVRVVLLGVSGLVTLITFVSARRWGPAHAVATALSAAVLSDLALHPFVLMSFVTQQRQASTFAWSELAPRSARSLRAVLALVIPEGLATPHKMLWLVVGIAAGVGIARAAVRRPPTVLRSRPDGEWIPSVVGVGSLVSIGLLYVLCLSPQHAMGARYLAGASPLLFLCVGQALDRLQRWPGIFYALLVLVLGWQATYAVDSTLAFTRTQERLHQRTLALNGTPMVLDSVARGILPRIVWHAAAVTPVFAASQDQLLGHFPRIPPSTPQIIYVSDPSVYGTADKRDRLLTRFEALGFRIAAEGSVYGVGAAYRLERARGR